MSTANHNIQGFLKFVSEALNTSYAQNLQDLWGLWEGRSLEKGYFVEFGALSGINVSNTYLMEKIGWDGIVAEPHPGYKDILTKSRNCNISYDAVYSVSGNEMIFNAVVGFPALSTLKESMPEDNKANTERRQNSNEHIVKTISLNDLLVQFNAPKLIDFISIDTEGSELDILSTFDFSKYTFRNICIEYGTKEKREAIKNILTKHGYQRKWMRLSDHDDWYYNRAMIDSDYSEDKINSFTKKLLNHEHSLMEKTKNRLRAKVNNLTGVTQVNKKSNQNIGTLPLPEKGRGMKYRRELTLSCKDCEAIPKVSNAGGVQTLSDGTKVQVMHNGVKVLAHSYIGPWMTSLIKELKGHHEPQEELVFHEILKHIKSPNPKMIEFGCYWAYYSCWFKHQFPTANIYGIEPHKQNLEFGKTNFFKINNFEGGEFIHGFTGKKERVQGLLNRDKEGVFSRNFYSVNDIFTKYNIDFLDILHLDIQGAETDVLENAQDLLVSKKIQFVVVSTHIHYISGDPLTHQKCIHLLEKAGGKILVEHDVYESFSGDGLICAYFGDNPDTIPEIKISFCRYAEGLYRNPVYDLYLAKN